MNVPSLKGSRALFVGAGGGFDVFAAIPLVTSFSFEYFELANFGRDMNELLRRATKEDYPEGGLLDYPVWILGRQGVINTKNSLQKIVDCSNLDVLFVVDGGVDSLMRGDEENSGTILEDFIVLAAAQEVKIANKYLVCMGFGCETEEQLNHYCVLENIASLIGQHSFLGSCSLTSDMQAYQIYKRLCENTWDKRRVSHIQGKVLAAIEGKFGNYPIHGMDAQLSVSSDLNNFISPLMSMYWFFDLDGVANYNKVIPDLKKSRIFIDAKLLLKQKIQVRRSKQQLPL